MFNFFRKWKCKKHTREVLNINEITYDELIQKIKDGAILIDVRTKQEFTEGHLDQSILIPYYDLYRKIQSLNISKDQVIIVYCQNGGRGQRAYTILKQLGYNNIFNLKEGIAGI